MKFSTDKINIIEKIKQSHFCNRWLLGAFFSCFILCFGFLFLIFCRYSTITLLRQEISRLQTSLNNSGWDIAYDKLEFNVWWPLPILEVSNFKLYSLYEPVRAWNISHLSLNTSPFDFQQLHISFSSEQSVQYQDETYDIRMPQHSFSFSFTPQDGIKEILLGIDNLQIKDIAKIGEIKLGAQRMQPYQQGSRTPFFENHLLIKNIEFSDNVDFPVNKQIDKIYLNSKLIGKMQAADTYNESIYNWLAYDGQFEIVNLVAEWQPFIAVARGDMYFNEKLEPRINLSASTRALIPTLDELEEAGVLDRKGVFVSRILLRNKSFKMSSDDEFDTIVTPINYKDKQIFVENIPIAGFN